MDDGLRVPGKPDGMAAFPGPDGKTILIRNHEVDAHAAEHGPFGDDNGLFDRISADRCFDRGRNISPCPGGTTTIVYNTQEQRVEKQFLSLAGTLRNCAGGPTPWNSWITCEETVHRADEILEEDHGYVFDVPATADVQLAKPVALKSMGRCNHEAVAVDPRTGIVYLTEDRDDGLLFRFIPNVPEKLAEGGKLQALKVKDKPSMDTRNWRERRDIPIGHFLPVEWMDVEDVESPNDDLRIQGFANGAACFARGEGMWMGKDVVYFACTSGGYKRKGQIWRYKPSAAEGTAEEKSNPGTLELFIEPNDASLLDNADNLTVAPWGDLIVCEDTSRVASLVGVTPEGKLYKFADNVLSSSELAGVTFSPDASTLFVNLQHDQLTLAITGPWDRIRS